MNLKLGLDRAEMTANLNFEIDTTTVEWQRSPVLRIQLALARGLIEAWWHFVLIVLLLQRIKLF